MSSGPGHVGRVTADAPANAPAAPPERALRRRPLAALRGREWDWVQPAVMALLTLAGLLFIHSATAAVEAHFWEKQLVWALLGAGLYVVAALVDYRVLFRQAHLVYGVGLLLLLLLWLPGIGEVRYGARRWIDLRLLTFQPSEAAKFSVLVIIASVLARAEARNLRASFATLGKVALLMGAPMLLIFLQPDLGSALVIVPMILALLYVSRLPQRFMLRLFGGLLGAGLLLVAAVAVDAYRYVEFLEAEGLSAHTNRDAYERHSWLPLNDYQRSRVASFLFPDLIDPSGTGVNYNTNQSRISIGTGGLLGKGWGHGTQAKLGYLPQTVAHNDFIFSVLAEETGFVGGAAVLGLFACLIGRGLWIAGQARDRFGLFLATGVSVIFAVHVFVNVGMTLGLLPVKGLPLPFLSYGGTFLALCCLQQGVVQSVFRHRRHA